MNKKIVEFYILPLLRTLIDQYLTQFSGTDLYPSRAEPLYNFYEWVYQQSKKD